MQPAQGVNPEKRYPFVVEFLLHCFTHGPNTQKGETLANYPSELYYEDSRETRVFCFRRHELSFLLPDIARTIATRKCYHTGKGNFFTVELPGAEEDEVEEYEIYFQVSRNGKKGGGLRLTVESAYVRDNDHESSQPVKKKIKFFVIAHNRLKNKPVKAPK